MLAWPCVTFYLLSTQDYLTSANAYYVAMARRGGASGEDGSEHGRLSMLVAGADSRQLSPMHAKATCKFGSVRRGSEIKDTMSVGAAVGGVGRAQITGAYG